jgi:hypothetical protein
MGVLAKPSIDRKALQNRPDPAAQPPISTLGKYFYQLEMKGIPYTFLTCSLAASTKCAASLMSQPFKQIQQIKNIPLYNGPTTFVEIMQKIYHNKHSFFTGSKLNIGRAGLREYSSFFFLDQISPRLKKTLPAAWQSSESIKQVMNGTLIAAWDIALYGPMERLSNVQVTHEQRTGMKLSIRQAYQTLPSVFSLWKGSSFNMIKSSYGWISFLGLHGNTMNFFEKHGIDRSAGSVSVVGADVAIALVNAPVMNAFGVLYNQSTGAHPLLNKNVIDTARHIYNKQGSKAFFAGTPQTFLLSVFSIVSRGWALQKIEQLHQEKKYFYKS